MKKRTSKASSPEPTAPGTVIRNCVFHGGASEATAIAVQKLADAITETAQALRASAGSAGLVITQNEKA